MKCSEQCGHVADLETFYSEMVARGMYTNTRSLRGQLDRVFNGIDLKGKRVLDVGGGDGLLSFYAGCKGASEAICLEPESAGSTSGITQKFNSVRDALGLQQVKLELVTFQDFKDQGLKFDVIVSYNSINHLDEPACVKLLDDENSRRIYQKLFARMSSMLNPGGKLIICDCSRHNFWAKLGMKNPVANMIEWHKHQAPETWISLMRPEGFQDPSIQWTAYNYLGTMGKLLLGNRLCSYFLESHFRLTASKP